MAKSVGCTHVLVGHSERRELFGETDEMTNLKTRKIIDSGMTAVLCIGETKDEYEAGQAKSVCARQLAAGLAGVEADEMTRVIIAYEPVWAIGTGLTAKNQMETSHLINDTLCIILNLYRRLKRVGNNIQVDWLHQIKVQ